MHAFIRHEASLLKAPSCEHTRPAGQLQYNTFLVCLHPDYQQRVVSSLRMPYLHGNYEEMVHNLFYIAYCTIVYIGGALH